MPLAVAFGAEAVVWLRDGRPTPFPVTLLGAELRYELDDGALVCACCAAGAVPVRALAFFVAPPRCDG